MIDYIKKALRDIKLNKAQQHKVFRKDQVQKQAHNKKFQLFPERIHKNH